jgi:lysophospholipase L1-like esterase/chitodextrinase
MARRSLYTSLVVGALVAVMLPLSASAVDPLPASIAAVGDSISQAASSGGSLGADYPANAWSTGTNATVNSHYARLLALNPAISGHAWNDSVSGAKMADLAGQMRVAAGQRPDYLTVLVGGNDLCTDTVGQMTAVSDFRAQFTTAMNTLTAGSPGTSVLVVSIPRVYQLWELFKSNFWARSIWSLGDICQSLLANPTSTQAADVQRRAQVAQRNVDYNTQLAEVCAQYARCRFDGNAVYNVAFAKSDVSGDYFHPSIAGQAKLAAVSWAAGYWPNGGPTPDAAPTAAFAASCTGLSCTFDASASTDDHGITGYGWTFGDGASGAGLTASHAFASAGTFTVALVVTDTAGQTGTAAKAVTVTAPSALVHLAGASGSATLRKSGWTATATVSVTDGPGSAVAGATVTGTWSTGAAGSCVTAATGSCSFSVNVGRKTPSVTWTVSGITAAGYGYDASVNLGSPLTITGP